MKWLDQELEAYGQSDSYPFHMPGHKRRSPEPMNPYQIDITEIGGFDNLHHPQGLIRDLQEEIASIYGMERSYLLVNGSTLGNLVSILSVAKRGQTVLIARNCHKSVYHAVSLGSLRVDYIQPEALGSGIQGPVTPASVRKMLTQHPDATAVVITSPTYEGIVSDIRSIAREVHKTGAVLIVDAAHGAHFGMDPYFPESMAKQGADVIVMSLHKTLPCFTQTAVLHLPFQSRIDYGHVEKMLDILETSSPSYILMAQTARCMRFLKEQGRDAFSRYASLLKKLRESLQDLKHLSLLEEVHMDPSKIVISTRGTSLTGEELMTELREKYHLEMEMCSFNYVLAMTSVMDTEEGFQRLDAALHEIDVSLADAGTRNGHGIETRAITGNDRTEAFHGIDNTLLYAPRRQVIPFAEADMAEKEQKESVPLKEASGRIAGETVMIYPPGIPIVVCGEEITEEVTDYIQKAMDTGLEVIGTQSNIAVFKETGSI